MRKLVAIALLTSSLPSFADTKQSETVLVSSRQSGISDIGMQSEDLLANRSKLNVVNQTDFETTLGRTLRLVWKGDVDGGYQEDILPVNQSITRQSKGIGNGGNYRNFPLEIYREKNGAFSPTGSITISIYNPPFAAGSSGVTFRTYFAFTGDVVLSATYPINGELTEVDVVIVPRSSW